VNKCRHHKYGKLPTKLLSPNLGRHSVWTSGPYTLKAKDKTQIDFMRFTLINPAASWFEIVELPVSQLPELDVPMGTKGKRTKTLISKHNNPTSTGCPQ